MDEPHSTEMEELRKQLKDYEDKLNLAGNFGKQLLEANNELNIKLEKISQEHLVKLEELEQEKYCLEMKLDQKLHVERDLSEEIEHLKVALKNQKQLHQEFLDTKHTEQINELKDKIRELQNDIEKHIDTEKQHVDKHQLMEDANANLKDQLEKQLERMNDSCSDDIAALNTEIKELYEEKNALELETTELKACIHDREMNFAQMKLEIEEKKAEIEEVECKSTSYYNALEKSRDEVKELKMEIDQIRMESHDMKKKGNSLFAEVEDRRVIAEKALIGLKVKNSSLEKQLEATRQQLHKLKMQFAGMLQMTAGKADSKYIDSLQQQLTVAHSEQRKLLDQLKQYQEKENEEKYENSGGENHVEFLKTVLKTKDQEIAELKSQEHTRQLCFLAKSDDLRKCERRYHAVQQQVDVVQGQNIKLALQVEDLQLKYEPHKIKNKAVKMKFRVEQLDTGEKVEKKEEEVKEDAIRTDRTEKENKTKEAEKTKKTRMDPKVLKALMEKVPKSSSAPPSSRYLQNKSKTGSGKKVGISEKNTVLE